jgi:hypothetical protein
LRGTRREPRSSKLSPRARPQPVIPKLIDTFSRNLCACH